jgi:hypothetical protein
MNIPTLKSHSPNLCALLNEPVGKSVKKGTHWSLQKQDAFGVLQTTQGGVAWRGLKLADHRCR